MMIQFFSRFPSNSSTSTTGQATSTATSATSATTTTTTSGSSTTGTTGSFEDLMIFQAVPSQTGYAGQFVVDGYSTDIAKIGDKGMYNVDTYRTILSFDTSFIPSRTISRAVLRIYRQSLQGTVTSLSLDINDSAFNGNNQLQLSDYNAPASAVSIASLKVPDTDNSYSEVDLPQSAFQYIHYTNQNGRTAFRLRASTTPSFTANTLFIYGGEDETSDYAPSLTVYFS